MTSPKDIEELHAEIRKAQRLAFQTEWNIFFQIPAGWSEPLDEELGKMSTGELRKRLEASE